jgi:hypothetical protein
MTIELDDEVATPRFEDTLWRELAAIHESAQSDPAVADPGWARPGRRMILVGAGTIAAAAALVTGLVVTTSGDRGNGGDVDLAAKIVTATESALDDSVVHETTTFGRSPSAPPEEEWWDETSGNFRFLHYGESGVLSSDFGIAPGVDPGSATTLTYVDYCYQEWSESTPPWTLGEGLSFADSILVTLEDGSMTVDGTEVVDGRELLVLHDASAPDTDWYVDPDTYRPVSYHVGEGDTEGGPIDVTFEFLPRTPDTLALLTIDPIPPTFTQVPDENLQRHDGYIPGCS